MVAVFVRNIPWLKITRTAWLTNHISVLKNKLIKFTNSVEYDICAFFIKFLRKYDVDFVYLILGFYFYR